MRHGKGTDLPGMEHLRATNVGVIYISPNEDRETILAAILSEENLKREKIVLILPQKNKAFRRPRDFDELKMLRRKIQAELIFVTPAGPGPADFARQHRFAVFSTEESFVRSFMADSAKETGPNAAADDTIDQPLLHSAATEPLIAQKTLQASSLPPLLPKTPHLQTQESLGQSIPSKLPNIPAATGTGFVEVKIASPSGAPQHTPTSEYLDLLKQGTETWNTWKRNNPTIRPDLSEVDLRGADLSNADLSNVNLRKADLSIIFNIADLSEANLSGTNLSEANLIRTNLSGANLSGADLSDANLRDADLSGANLNGANLNGANLSGADLSRTQFWGANLSRADLGRAKNLSRADLSSFNFSEANLNGANLSGANLSGADLSRTQFWGANLSRADLRGANLSRADLSDADLSDADLSMADLRMAYLRKVNLSKANLSKANLFGAYLSWANLQEANLQEANLFGTYLKGADLREADLRRADLRMANFSWTDIRAGDGDSTNPLTQAVRTGANLRRADLSLTNPREVDKNTQQPQDAVRIGADLSGANLSGANLRGADLSLTNLSRACLHGADLSWANLSGADFSRADLSGSYLYATSVWDVNLEDAMQSNLIIKSPDELDESAITVDNLEVAQFIYLLLKNQKIRDAIDTITSKVALILGRFIPERKVILDALRDELRKHNYLPILFDFEKPGSRDLTETVSILAHLARFIVVDLTDPSSAPHEVATIIPQCIVPVQPLLTLQPFIVEGKEIMRHEYAMFEDLRRRYHWVLPTFRYQNTTDLLTSLKENIIEPAEKKAQELEKQR